MLTNETLETLKTRRSCRAYKPDQITEAELAAVLEGGTYAPTAMGLQSPKIVVIQDAATRAELSRMNAAVMGREGADPMYGAPTYLLVLADAHRPAGRQPGDGQPDERRRQPGAGQLLDQPGPRDLCHR